MSFYLTVPGKTFMLGEYAVLKGSPALLLATNPRFELFALERDGSSPQRVNGIHEESPAGKLLAKDYAFYKNYDIQFKDPYQGIGGLGASSAQFLMIAALKQILNSQQINEARLLETYQEVAWNGEGVPPSGADIMAQLHGKICYFYKNKKIINTFNWPFNELQYCLIHTNAKLATHTHLKNLSYERDDELEKIVEQGFESLKKSDTTNFIAAINAYAKCLQAKKLVSTITHDILQYLALHPAILACKGCGALGADVILVIFRNQDQQEVLSWMQKKNLNVLKHSNEVADGLILEAI